MPKAYAKAIRDKAQEMYENGISEPKIAKELGIKRHQTINDWRVKYGWKRKDEVFLGVMRDLPTMREFWETIGRKAQEYLEHVKFKSPTEAIKILREATDMLREIDKLEERESENHEEQEVSEEADDLTIRDSETVLKLLDKDNENR